MITYRQKKHFNLSFGYFGTFRFGKIEKNICILEILFVTLRRKTKTHSLTMKKIVRLILLLTLLIGSSVLYAAPQKAKTFTKRYKNEKLIVVLNDLCHRNGYTLNILDEIDENKRITAEFKNAKTGSVLRKVLDKEFQGKVRKGVLTISRKPTPPQTFTVTATTPAEITENDSLTRIVYMDTVYTVQCGMKTIEHVEKQESVKPDRSRKEDKSGVNRIEHNIQVLVGAGYSSMGYNLKSDGAEIGFVGLNAQFRYLYYFAPNWGIGLGVGFSNYGSTGTLNTTTAFSPNIQDTDVPIAGTGGEDYEHRVKTHDWREWQRAYMVDIPVMIQCTYPIPNVQMDNGPLKIYADLGVDIGMNVSASRKLTGGSIDHVGWYKPWKLELSGIDGHDFYSENASDFETEKQKLNLRLPAVGIMADLGFALPLREDIDLLIGLYANYVANDVCAKRQDIGWKNTNATGYKTHDFMNAYAGIIGTQYAAAVHPWQAGVRIGINFNTRTKPAKKKEIINTTYTRVNVCDTTFTLKERVETSVKAVVVQQIKRVLAKSVIWFDLNSSEPNLKPADILVKVAEILKENPAQKILVTGHASRDGDKAKNEKLSAARAKAVVDMLIALGVQPGQIESRAEGVERDYIQGSHDISLDRRVEITPVE